MIDIQEICRKLKPLIGHQADCYWMAYLAEDAAGKKEIADMIQLLAYQLLGVDFEHDNIQLSVPPATKA
jgi:hypothetical protein